MWTPLHIHCENFPASSFAKAEAHDGRVCDGFAQAVDCVLLNPFCPAKIFKENSVDQDRVIAGVQAHQLVHALNATSLGHLFHPTTIGQQMAGGDLDSLEILQRGPIARKDLDRINPSSVLQNIAHTDLTHLTNASILQHDVLMSIKAELIEESNGLTNGSVHDGLTRRNSHIHQVHQNRKGSDQPHEHGTNAGHQLLHLAQSIGQLSEDRSDHCQESVPNALESLSQTL